MNNNEEFEVFDDNTSEHANLPKVLINSPNLFDKKQLNKRYNGISNNNRYKKIEQHKKLINKNKLNENLYSLKLEDNSDKNEKKQFIILSNRNNNKLSNSQKFLFNKNNLAQSQKIENIKKTGKDSPKLGTEVKKNIRIRNNNVLKRTSVSNGINNPEPNTEQKKKIVRHPIKRISLKIENNENTMLFKNKLNSLDNKKLKNKNMLRNNTSNTNFNESQTKAKKENLNKQKILMEKKRVLNKSRDFNMDKINEKNELYKKIEGKKILLNLNSKGKNKTNIGNFPVRKRTSINSIKNFSSNSSNFLFKTENVNNSTVKNIKKASTKKLSLQLNDDRNTFKINKLKEFETDILNSSSKNTDSNIKTEKKSCFHKIKNNINNVNKNMNNNNLLKSANFKPNEITKLDNIKNNNNTNLNNSNVKENLLKKDKENKIINKKQDKGNKNKKQDKENKNKK